MHKARPLVRPRRVRGTSTARPQCVRPLDRRTPGRREGRRSLPPSPPESDQTASASHPNKGTHLGTHPGTQFAHPACGHNDALVVFTVDGQGELCGRCWRRWAERVNDFETQTSIN